MPNENRERKEKERKKKSLYLIAHFCSVVCQSLLILINFLINLNSFKFQISFDELKSDDQLEVYNQIGNSSALDEIPNE